MDATARGFAFVTVSAVSFGGVAVLGKLLIAAGMTVPAMLFWRWLFAALALAPVAGLAARRLGGRTALGAFLIGFLGYAGTSGVFMSSLPYVSAALASFLLFLNPVFVALLSALLVREALTRRGYVSLALSVAGLALLAFSPGVGARLLGVALGLTSAVLYAFTILAGRRVVADEDPLPVSFLVMVGAAAAFAVGGLASGTWMTPPTRAAWLHVALLGVVSTGVSVAFFYLALPLIGAPRASLVSTLEPVSTAVLAFFVLGEALRPLQTLGALLILLAVALLTTERRPEAPFTAAGASSPPAT